MDKPWKVIFAFVAVFAAGAVAGSLFGARRVAKRFRGEPAPVVVTLPEKQNGTVVAEKKIEPPVKEPNRVSLAPPLPAPQLRQWAQRFNLSTEQQKAIRPIIAKTNEEYGRLRIETTRVTEGMYADISAILTEEQRADFEEMKKKFQERIELERRKRIEQQQAENAAKKAGNRPQSE